MYQDGAPGNPRAMPSDSPALGYGSVPWRIGVAGPSLPEYGWPMNGFIDDVRIYDRALTADDIRRLASQ